MMYQLLVSIGHWIARRSSKTVERMSFIVAVLAFDLLRVRRRVILNNLKIAFPERKTARDLRRIGRMSIYHFVLNMAEFFRSVDEDITRDITMIGREHIDQALSQGKGVYVLCFHMGNWEAMGAMYTKSITPSHILVKKVGKGGIARFVDGVREHNGFLTVKRQRKGDGIKAIRDILQANEIVGFVIDQARPGEPRLPFFSKPAKTNTSFAAIWAKHPAPIIPSYITRSGLGHHTLRFLPEVQLSQGTDLKQDIIDHSIQFNKIVEQVVLSEPEQYFWMHNRWKA